MKNLKYTKDEAAHHIWIEGKKDIQAEPVELHIHYPGGELSVTRCSNNDYWVHVDLTGNERDTANRVRRGRLVDARIDCTDVHVTKMDKGDLNNPTLHHFAVKIRTGEELTK